MKKQVLFFGLFLFVWGISFGFASQEMSEWDSQIAARNNKIESEFEKLRKKAEKITQRYGIAVRQVELFTLYARVSESIAQYKGTNTYRPLVDALRFLGAEDRRIDLALSSHCLQNQHLFLTSIKDGLSIEDAATHLLKASFSQDMHPHLERVKPLKIRLRLAALQQEPLLKNAILWRTLGKTEESAYASLVFLTRFSCEEVSRFLMHLKPFPTATYLTDFTAQCPLDMSSRDVITLLQMSELAPSDLAALGTPAVRAIFFHNQKFLESTLTSILLRLS